MTGPRCFRSWEPVEKKKRGPERSRRNDGNEAKKRKKEGRKDAKERPGEDNEKHTKRSTKRAHRTRDGAEAHHAPGCAEKIADDENL